MNSVLPPELPSFDDPIGLLRACHDRMLDHCELLEKLVTHISEHGIDTQAKQVITNIQRYFTTSAVYHHQDEEENLFPLLNRQSLKLTDLIFRLNKEHRELNDLWDLINRDLNVLSSLTDNSTFSNHVEKFCSHYRKHITLENEDLLPMAQHIISSQQLEDMGKAMADRRGVTL